MRPELMDGDRLAEAKYREMLKKTLLYAAKESGVESHLTAGQQP